MGIFLAKDGGLTEAQKVQQQSMGISVEEMKKFVVDRLVEIRGGKTPETVRSQEMKREVIQALNPVLIIAGGPSWRKNITGIRNFPNTVIVVDVLFNEIVSKYKIKPDIVVTLESSTRIINPDTYLPENLARCKHKTSIVGSSITATKIKRHVRKFLPYSQFVFEEEPRCSNVGNFAMNYAYNELYADKIFVLGFEHSGTKYPPATYTTWQTDFWYFIRKMPKETIVNCSKGGSLYYEDYIIDADMDYLKIHLV